MQSCGNRTIKTASNTHWKGRTANCKNGKILQQAVLMGTGKTCRGCRVVHPPGGGGGQNKTMVESGQTLHAD